MAPRHRANRVCRCREHVDGLQDRADPPPDQLVEESIPAASTGWWWSMGDLAMGSCSSGVANSNSAVHHQAAGTWMMNRPSALAVAVFLSMWPSLEGEVERLRIGLTCLGAILLWRAWPMISFVSSKLASENTKMRHRQGFKLAQTWKLRMHRWTKTCRFLASDSVLERTAGYLDLSRLDPKPIKRSLLGWW